MVVPADGAPRRSRSPPRCRSPARRLRRRRVLLGPGPSADHGRPTARLRGRRRPARRDRAERRPDPGARRRCGHAGREAGGGGATAAAPRWRPAATGSRSCSRRDDACDVAVVPLAGGDGRHASCRTPTTRGIPRGHPTARALAWHEWDLPAMPWDALADRARAARRSTRRAARGRVAGGADVAVGQPRFSPDGDRARLRARRERLDERVGGDGRRRRRPSVARRHRASTPSRPGAPGQRSFAWSPDGRRIALNRNEEGFGRLVVVDVGTPRRADERLEGLAPRPRLGRRGHRRASAPAGAPRPRSRCSTRPARDRTVGAAGARRPRRARRPRPPRTRAGHVARPTTARPCTASCGGPPTPARVEHDRRCSSTSTAAPRDQAAVGWAPRVRCFV